MIPQNILEISDREQLRDWFTANHDVFDEFWLRCNRSRNKVEGIIQYTDAVEVALCFGWIDSTLKRIDDGKAIQRFTPRRKCSNWSDINIERCHKLIAAGEMTQQGLKAFMYAFVSDNFRKAGESFGTKNIQSL